MISTFIDLVAAVDDWLDREDLALKAPTFIQLAEARLNRLLEDPEMEVTSTSVAAGDYTALPSDFGAMVSVSTGNGGLLATGPVEFASYDTTISGTPRRYVIVDGSIAFWPGNSTANIRIVYRRRIPALTSTNTSNWLLTLAPDIYLYGALVQAEGFLVEDDRLELWKSAFDEAIGELRQEGSRRKWGAGPIGPRIRRP